MWGLKDNKAFQLQSKFASTILLRLRVYFEKVNVECVIIHRIAERMQNSCKRIVAC